MMKFRSNYWAWSVACPSSSGKLISFLQERLGSQYSQRSIKKALEANLCRINGRIERFASTELSVGDLVEFSKDWKVFSQRKTTSIEVLFEDAYFYAIYKPAGICCDQKLVDLCSKDTKLFLLHRLDRRTTGVLLFAKSKIAQEKMIALFRKKQVDKTYLALVDGKVARSSGKIDNRLSAKKRIEGQTLYGSTFSQKGKIAQTLWKRLKNGKDYALLECTLITGRTHQLRVHLSEMGHPILGDALYCRSFRSSIPCERPMLHAWKMAFIHPITQEKIAFIAKPPKLLSSLLS